MSVHAQLPTRPVRVTLLVDNVRGAPGLRAQWGFSAWIEHGDRHVLFDCGCNDAFARNARALGVALGDCDAFVLSHGHFDHGGGIARLVGEAPAARLFLHRAALAPRLWLCKTGRVDDIGLPERSLHALGDVAGRVSWVTGPTELLPGTWVSGPIPRRHPLEEAERNFFADQACTMRDPVVDDQALWFITPQGLVVLVGCAHAGIINTLDHVRRLATELGDVRDAPPAADGLPRVAALIGGLHLLHASPARLRATGEALAAAEVGALAAVHCTGKRGKDHLSAVLPHAWRACTTGSVVEVG